MAKQNGNMYDWITHTANPLAGDCIHKCSYCYMNKLKAAKPAIKEKYSGEPRLSETGLSQISGKDKFIFITDCADLFANDVSWEIINKIIQKCISKQENRYLLQTKNTERLYMNRILFSGYPELFSLCTTIETNRTFSGSKSFLKHFGNSPLPVDRLNWFQRLTGYKKYVTIEPIMDFDVDVMVNWMLRINPVQINVGADSGNNHLPEPTKEKILTLISELEKFTIVKQKSNLNRLLV